ncbi:osiris 5 [Choristoneura fumiferana]|uniref:osiris 5 n=1 Tax=Choristoneura fumiferana TaxID=7141 RepID=UPI003D157BB6
MYRDLFIIAFLCSSALGSFLDGDFDLADGVKLVSIPVSNSLEDEGRSFGENSALFRMAKFLQGHELRVKLPNLIEKDKISRVFEESLKTVDETYKDSAVTGRGKGGGGGSAALLGLMFAKTLGAVGIGGLGLLTMKALAAAALALMLSAIVGVKKLTSHDDHDDHQVIYAGHHGHHRRKREATPLPYRGWAKYAH